MLSIPWERRIVMTSPERNRRRRPERPLAGQVQAQPKGASKLLPPRIEVTAEDLSFANVLQDCLTSGVIFIDAKHQRASLNPRAKQLLGLPPAPTSPSSLAVLPAPLRATVRKALATGRTPAGRQVEFEAAERGSVTLHVSAIPVQAGRKISGVVLVLNDLTPARQIEQHIQQLDRLASVGTLAAGMAHEIKNALVAGRTFVDLLLEKHQDAELVDVVRREMGRIDTIVSRMRSFAGPAQSTFSAVSLHEILDYALRLVQPQLEAKTVILDRSFLASPDVIHGDDYRLQQAFVNLFLNAVEAMGANGTLSVATDLVRPDSVAAKPANAAGRPRLRVTIRDTGIGIRPEHLARLFEPFFTTKPTGTGLGLLITRRIIQEHRGTITFESEPDKGTAFQILLPAVEAV